MAALICSFDRVGSIFLWVKVFLGWHMDFMDIFVFLNKWKEDAEYFERYREVEKILTPAQS